MHSIRNHLSLFFYRDELIRSSTFRSPCITALGSYFSKFKHRVECCCLHLWYAMTFAPEKSNENKAVWNALGHPSSIHLLSIHAYFSVNSRLRSKVRRSTFALVPTLSDFLNDLKTFLWTFCVASSIHQWPNDRQFVDQTTVVRLILLLQWMRCNNTLNCSTNQITIANMQIIGKQTEIFYLAIITRAATWERPIVQLLVSYEIFA